MDNSSSIRIAIWGKRVLRFTISMALLLVAALATGASFHMVLHQDQPFQGIILLGLGAILLYFAGEVLN